VLRLKVGFVYRRASLDVVCITDEVEEATPLVTGSVPRYL
jgi:hypothetical protein